MPKTDSIYIPDKKIHKVAVEAAHNNLYSLLLLTKTREFSGLDTWANRTFQAMTARERKDNHLVIEGFYHGLKPDSQWADFPEYVKNLAEKDPREIRKNLIRQYLRKAFYYGNRISRMFFMESGDLDVDQIFKSRDRYLQFLAECFAGDLDPELESSAYSFLSDPRAMQDLTVTHFEHMWSRYLREEWEKNEPMLNDMVKAFQQYGLDHMNELDLFKFLTNRDQWEQALQAIVDKANFIIFAPSPHIGPYVGEMFHGDSLWILFGAGFPKKPVPDRSRVRIHDVINRLNALSDETRLRILRLFLENRELSSQAVMTELNLSQSATSRHLKQLSASEFLIERRSGTRKYFRMNPDKIRRTLTAVIRFLTKE